MLKNNLQFNSSVWKKSAYIFVAGFLLLFFMPSSSLADTTIYEDYTGYSSFTGYTISPSFVPLFSIPVTKVEQLLYSNYPSGTTYFTLQEDISVGHDGTSLTDLDCFTDTRANSVWGATSEFPRVDLTMQVIDGFSGTQCTLDVLKYYRFKATSVGGGVGTFAGSGNTYVKVSGGIVNTSTHFISTDPVPSIEGSFGTIVSGSDVLTNVYPLIGVVNGMQVQATCIPESSFVGSFTSDTVHVVDVHGDPVNATCNADPAFVSFIQPKSASASAFSTTINVNPTDFESGMKLCMYYYNDGVETTGFLLDRWVSVAPDQCFDIVSSGESSYTSSSHEFGSFSGLSTVVYIIKKPSSVPLIGFLFNSTDFLQKRIRFVIGQLSQFDRAVQDGTVGSSLLSNLGLEKILSCSLSDSFAHFDLGDCLKSLLIPTSKGLLSSWCQFKDGKQYNVVSGLCDGSPSSIRGVLNVFPFGYVTRFISILTDTTSVEPPALTYSFGTSSPTDLQGKTVSFQIWDHMDTLNSIKSDQGTNKNLWDIVMPWWKVFVNLALFLAILYKLMDIQIQTDFTQDTSTNSSTDSSGLEVVEDKKSSVGMFAFSSGGITNRYERDKSSSHLAIKNPNGSVYFKHSKGSGGRQKRRYKR